MPAPKCTGHCSFTVVHCPLHEAAGDLYAALEQYLELPADPSDMQQSEADQQARAALLKANPQRTQEQKDDAK
jgi:hypothetical protein